MHSLRSVIIIQHLASALFDCSVATQLVMLVMKNSLIISDVCMGTIIVYKSLEKSHYLINMLPIRNRDYFWRFHFYQTNNNFIATYSYRMCAIPTQLMISQQFNVSSSYFCSYNDERGWRCRFRSQRRFQFNSIQDIRDISLATTKPN